MAYTRELSFIYRSPTRIIFGEKAADGVGMEVDALGGTRALIVTDEGLVATGLVARIEKALGRRFAGVFSECPQDSAVHIVNKGAELAREQGVDILVSVGGGSCIDTAKGMAILLKEGGQLSDYKGFQMLTRPIAPHIVIPTTTGTGSEATYAMVVKDWDKNVKLIFADDHIFPDIAILDPTMVAGLPPALTASTGMDAMTHAVEAIHAMQREPISDALALHAIRLIVENLPRCVEKGDDLVARGQQLIAATMAGIAFSQAQVGVVHAMAHCVGARFKVPHGVANAILLPYGMEYNLDECPDRYAMVAQAMGIDTRGMSDEEAGRAAINAILDLTKRLGLPQRLRQVGVSEEGLAMVAEDALYDGSIVYNPKSIFEAEEVLKILKKAW